MSRQRRRTWTELRAEMVNSPARAVGTLYRSFQAAANEGYARRGWTEASLTHVQFLSEIEEAGTRLSDVAAALGTTKQYAGKLARDLESRGLITLGDDPSDARAVLATPTSRGRAFFEDACDVRAELEAEFLARLSPTRATAFVAMLEDLVAGSPSGRSRAGRE
jgi:DNA-binding MarR family transcriptional regulator